MREIMKKMTTAILTCMLAFAIALLTPAALQANEIGVTINGTPVIFEDQTPTIIEGRTLVPVADVFRALGFTASWDGNTRQTTLENRDYRIVIAIDSDRFFVNGTAHTLDVPAQIIDGRNMLPIRAVLESVGKDVDWDGGAQVVVITYQARGLRGSLVNRQWSQPEIIYNSALWSTTDPGPSITLETNAAGWWGIYEASGSRFLAQAEVQQISDILLALPGNTYNLASQLQSAFYQDLTSQITTETAQHAQPAQSRMGGWSEITIIGDGDFTRRTQQAIDLIRTGAPDLYQEILRYLGVVRQYSFSGMWYWLDPPEFRVGTASYTATVTWYASIIIHDAIHSRQAYENPLTFVDRHSQLWHDAEMEALDYQIKFFRRIGAPQSYINHISNLRNNPWWLQEVTWR